MTASAHSVRNTRAAGRAAVVASILAILIVTNGAARAQESSMSAPAEMSAPMDSSATEMSLEPITSEEEPSAQTSMEYSDPEQLPEDPVPPLEVLQAIFDVCTDVASGDPVALDRAAGAGWQAGDGEEGGPFRVINSGFRSFAGYDDANFRAVTDTFPTQRLGYCSGSLGDRDDRVTLADFGRIGDLKGSVTTQDGGEFGAWESADGKLMVFAGKSDGYLDYEFNILLPMAP